MTLRQQLGRTQPTADHAAIFAYPTAGVSQVARRKVRMNKAINYDVGMRASERWLSRPDFDPAVVSREMEIIKGDLGCSAVRIFGEDVDRLRIAAQSALDVDLRVWLSPDLFNAKKSRWLEYLDRCARMAQQLGSPDIVFVVGRELTFFMRGLVIGKDAFGRMKTFSVTPRLLTSVALRGSWNRNLNRFLRDANTVVRKSFNGRVTYAAGSWERVEWSRFDMACVDLYRDKMNAESFREQLRKHLYSRKPTVITEFGCCTYQGAGDRGSMGWDVVNRESTPPTLKENLLRNEHEQAQYVNDLLDIFREEGIETAFVFTFASYSYPHSPDPLYDLDLAAYGLFSCLRSGTGTTYPDMKWEPKEVFHTFASWNYESS